MSAAASLRSYSGPFDTRYFVLYFGWTRELILGAWRPVRSWPREHEFLALVARIDSGLDDRELICTCRELEDYADSTDAVEETVGASG